jgi:prolyl-tRNA synthetase
MIKGEVTAVNGPVTGDSRDQVLTKTTYGMRQSALFTKVSRDVERDEPSLNAQLLIRAGYVEKLMAGVYSFLPLGLRVLNKIENIVRDEMNQLGAQELIMPALQPRDPWEQTGRWSTVDVLFKFKGAGDRDLTLGPTHEEIVTPLVGRRIQSYRDLPIAVYQTQTKFRNEARAKSGLLRGREFRMKDMYSFHASQADLDAFYDRVIDAYKRVFQRCGVGDSTILTAASGGMFSKFSHEFQTITKNGEDTVYLHPDQDLGVNRELLELTDIMKELGLVDAQGHIREMKELKAIEVGNIFKLGTRFSDAFKLSFIDEGGRKQPVLMGCYGLGPSRLMGAVVETLSDDGGLKLPKEIAPYSIHLISLAKTSEEQARADEIYSILTRGGHEVLFDDRMQVRAGEKFAESDLIGIPSRLVVSAKTLGQNSVEYKSRATGETHMISLENLLGAVDKL